MPYVSTAQRGYFNSNRAKLEAQGVNVDEWNKASKGLKLPKHVGDAPMAKKPKTTTPMPKARTVKAPKQQKTPKVAVRPLHASPLSHVLGFNVAKKIPNPLLG